MFVMRNKNGINGLLELISHLPSKIVMAEIGCYAGESTKLFLSSGKVKKYYAIDLWTNITGFYKVESFEDIPGSQIESLKDIEEVYQKMSQAEGIFDNICKGNNVVKLKMDISKAIIYLPMLDFVYIDGNHSYDYVKQDILLSMSKVKKGGIIGGHDFKDKYKEHVIRAVNEIFGKPDKIFCDSSWIVYL